MSILHLIFFNLVLLTIQKFYYLEGWEKENLNKFYPVKLRFEKKTENVWKCLKLVNNAVK